MSLSCPNDYGTSRPILSHREVSPSDFVQILKRLIFVDPFDIPGVATAGMGLRPHSGTATATYLFDGSGDYEDTDGITKVSQPWWARMDEFRPRSLPWGWRWARARIPALGCITSRIREIPGRGNTALHLPEIGWDIQRKRDFRRKGT